ncbi:DNA translocase FtsK [Flectobacillus sp. DC10W]|uniref:DNA translocase FtsK n=1 Tax=Flectobacillus longus TaxID=2984207 RepID=A0ABT6YK88_9BACT|nr:DNA translocase FtsK [Flectobacillus longus]MDI9863999.1 DNA translocase FtsK [Flectobacillus longus]
MNRYKYLEPHEIEELLSNYLINSWSYSKVRTFASNEKDFERKYIYGEDSKRSSTTIAGEAYHKALDIYFSGLRESGHTYDITDLEAAAYEYIEMISPNTWKIQKTTPTIQECIINATKTVNQLLGNFLKDVGTYTDNLEAIICTEQRLVTWVQINGVDIPMPLHAVIDMVIKTKDGKNVIIDHKSKKAFTDDNEIRFSIGKQAITYVLAWEVETGEQIDEVWFVENKAPKNKDNSPQLICHKVLLDSGTRRLYEALLYEPLRRMLEAVSDPDYVYLLNDNDNLTDKAELYEFWAKTMIAEIDEFNVKNDKKPLVEARLRKIRDASLSTVSPNVIKNFRKYSEQFIPFDLSNKDMTNQEKIEHVLRSFNLMAKVQHTFEGYSSTSYLLEVGAGVSVSSITKYKLDIANALDVSNVRIQKDLFVYEGKSYLAIESVRKSAGTLFWDARLKNKSKIPLGIDNFQQTVFWDIENHSTPHMLVCGATGSGKSVFLRSIIEYANLEGFDEIFIFDPKYEFNNFSNVITTVVNDIEEIETQMGLLVLDMEQRVKSGTTKKTLVVFDEFADAVANSRKGNELNNYSDQITGYYKTGLPKTKRVVSSVDKSLEENLRILLQKGRSSGFRIIAATQRASTKVITGDAKVNFPVQVCFRVPKDIDSIVVIDEPGAEALNGRGDGLIKSPEYLGIVRFQAFYKS